MYAIEQRPNVSPASFLSWQNGQYLPDYAVAAAVPAGAAGAGPQLELAQDDWVPPLQDLWVRDAPAEVGEACSGPPN